MYEAFFHLDSRPFPSTPRVDRYFPASEIEDAFRTLSRCVERAEGPGLVIGGPGMGKSLLCEMLATRFRDRFHIVRLDSARLCTRRALLQNILFELNLPYQGTDEGGLRLSLIDFMEPSETAREGVLLLVDEAHTLPLRLIEEIRMITNLVRDGQPRARLVLAGDNTLEEHIANPKLESLNQRIAARCYLQPLTYDETIEFVRSQIAVVGGDPSQLFTDDALQAVYHASGGIPRLINQICDHALLLSCSKQAHHLTMGVVEEAWADLQQLPMPASSDIQTQESDSGVVEFGSLDDPLDTEEAFEAIEDGSLADEEADEDSTDIFEDDPVCEDAECATPVRQTSEIDLTSQLSVIEEHFQQIESFDATLVCEDAVLDAEPIDAEPPSSDDASSQGVNTEPSKPQTPRVTDPSDPFAETFAHEERVADHYTALEASRDGRGAGGARGQNRDFTSTLKTIFTPPDASEGLANDARTVEPTQLEDNTGLDETAELVEHVPATEHSEPPLLEQELSASLASTDTVIETVADATTRSDTATTRVLRCVPPDDSDLLVVVDEQLESERLEDLPERTHQRRYRDLFTRLRES